VKVSINNLYSIDCGGLTYSN